MENNSSEKAAGAANRGGRPAQNAASRPEANSKGDPKSRKKKKKKRYLSRVMYFKATSRRLIHHVALRTSKGAEIFKDEETCRNAAELLKSQAQKKRVGLFCYCLLPDGIEMIIRSPASISHTDFVRDFKGSINLALKGRENQESVWQTEFTDNMLLHRGIFEDTQKQIMELAAKRGIVKNPADYQWAESFNVVPKFYKKSEIKVPKSTDPRDEWTPPIKPKEKLEEDAPSVFDDFDDGDDEENGGSSRINWEQYEEFDEEEGSDD